MADYANITGRRADNDGDRMGTAMSENIKFNYSSVRSEKARIGTIFNRKVIILLNLVFLSLIAVGILVILNGSAVGWSLIGFSIVPAMVVEWYEGELHHQAIAKKPKSVDDVLSGDILGRLSKNPTPREVAGIIGGVSGGQFFAVRFGISSAFLSELASDNKDDMQAVWKKAWEIMNDVGSRNMSAAVLLTAIIKCAPNSRTLLSHLQLDEDELISGIKWYDHLRNLIELHRMPKRTGGVARDWSFGWTPLLDRFGQNISQQIGTYGVSLLKLVTHDDSLDQLVEIFSKKGRQNAVLVGPSGVGKTEIVTAFASKLLDASAKIPSELKFRQVFILDASSLIAAAPGRGELESLVPGILNEAYRAKNIIICLDNAQLFFEEGIGSVDIANVLMPIIQAGRLRMILTMDEQRYLKIAQRNPELANSLNRIKVSPANHEETIAIMQDQSVLFEFRNHVTYMHQAIAEAYRLSDRYVHGLAMPGKALSLMESAAHYAVNGLVTAESVRQAIEKTLDVKVSNATETSEREKLLNLENLIHERMVNQEKAVRVVSDALRRARAGVRNQQRPVGTFLFLGPTGVGKTELSKALAEVYYGGEDRIIRLDMNEYVSSADVKRLIADGSENPNSLTAKVMKQPFSLVLLDEIEKAHTDVLSTLLQMLDEGVLRDVSNREISFRDAIIIATSNAGADRLREFIERGYDIEKVHDQFIDELIRSKQFLPEFLNRFDEIVLFRPLNSQELLRVVDLILDGINKTLSLQKVEVSVADDAKKYLVEAGYDPKMGARPMRRVIQKAVENTVAKRLLSGDVEPGSVIEIILDDVSQILESKNAADEIIKAASEEF